MGTTQARKYKAGDYLFKEGDPSFSFFLVTKGTIGVRKKKGAGAIEIARIHPKEVLGELSFFDRNPRSASAIALNDVEALEITFEALDKIYANVPDYMKSIIASVADRLRKANDTIRRLQEKIIREGDEVEIEGLSSTDESDPKSGTEG